MVVQQMSDIQKSGTLATGGRYNCLSCFPFYVKDCWLSFTITASFIGITLQAQQLDSSQLSNGGWRVYFFTNTSTETYYKMFLWDSHRASQFWLLFSQHTALRHHTIDGKQRLYERHCIFRLQIYIFEIAKVHSNIVTGSQVIGSGNQFIGIPITSYNIWISQK